MDESDFSEGGEEGEDAREEELDPNNPEHEFPILERNFNKTAIEIEQDPNAAQYAEEFHALFEKLFQNYQSKKSFEEKCTTLESEMAEKEKMLDLGSKLADVDKSTISDLKGQIEHAWKLADAAHSREQAAQEVIDNLRKQVENLNAEIDFRNKMGQDTTEEMGEANKRKEGIEREREKLMAEVTQLNQKLNNALEYQIELEKKTSVADIKLTELNAQVEDQSNELDRSKRIRDKLETDLTEMAYKIEDKDNLVGNLNNVINAHVKSIGKLENQMREDRISKDKVSKEFEGLMAKFIKLQDDHQATISSLDNMNKQYNKKLVDLKTIEEESIHLKNDIAKVTKTKDVLEKKILVLEGDKNTIVEDRNKLRQRVAVFEREIENLKKQIDADKRTVEAANRERDVINKNMIRQEAVNKDQAKLIRIHEQGKKKLELELDSFVVENNKNTKIIQNLARDKDRLAEEQIDLVSKIEDSLDEIKLKKAEVYDLKKSLTEQENKFKMQQNLYDAVRSERNALEKTLQESNAETGEIRKKLKISNHQIEQLKEDVSMKEQLLIKEENIFRKVLKEKENLKVDLNVANEHIKSLKNEIAEKDAEEKRLHKTIMENERLIKDQAKNLDQLMNERDILGSQVVRRNDEIALLHEKICILQTTLQRGESQYGQRLEDIRLLKIEIKRLRQEKNLLTKTVNNTVDLKQEIFHLERDLTKTRLKCRALEEEMQNPMNIHRWRKLEGSDPTALDLLQKVQILQKRLLKQSAEAVDRERQLKEAERLYLNLRQVLAKQPGPGIQEELNKTQRALKNRGDQLKCLVSELNMAELQSKEYKSDLQRVTDELNDLKRKYLADKKNQKNQKLAYESSRELNPNRQQQSGGGGQVKFTGGGFRMSVQSITSNN